MHRTHMSYAVYYMHQSYSPKDDRWSRLPFAIFTYQNQAVVDNVCQERPVFKTDFHSG